MKRHTTHSQDSHLKKVRFHKIESEEEELEDEEEELELPKARRGAVRLEGYQSSSEEEEEEEDEEKDKSMKDVDKSKEEENEEDGQDFTSFDRIDTESGNIKIEAFNMKAELEEGRFDEFGHYIRNPADPHAFHDRWLEGVTDEEIERAREAHFRRERLRREQEIEEERAMRNPEELIYAARLTLMELLQERETVTGAIRRFGQDIKSKSETKETSRQQLERITTVCDQLMGLGQLDVYEWTRERIGIDLARHSNGHTSHYASSEITVASTTSSNNANHDDETQWEFKWDPSPSAEIHGPHTRAELEAWKIYGYFGPSVVVRRVGESEFISLSDAGI
jgi:CD2 antigen cytoplasmic tail-binding protein 2